MEPKIYKGLSKLIAIIVNLCIWAISKAKWKKEVFVFLAFQQYGFSKIMEQMAKDGWYGCFCT